MMRPNFLMRRLRLVLFAGTLVTLGACSDKQGDTTVNTYGGRGRVASTQGGAIVMSYDEGVAVAVHRTAGFVSIVKLDPAAAPESLIRGVTELDVGIDAKPWAAVIGADDDTAYVLLRGTEQVVRISGLHDHPAIDPGGAVNVGNEPTSIAITPSGSRLYVANFGNGTVSMILTKNLVAQQRTDLNLALAATGFLGPGLLGSQSGDAGVWTDDELGSVRPGLAHPRAMAITDDGDKDDSDETLYVTDFFSQPIPTAVPDDPDQTRQGVVYPISLDTGRVQAPLVLAPVSTGFSDAKGAPTSCFPNQLYAAATSQNRLYVTAMCASPRGPIGVGPTPADGSSPSTANFQTMVHSAIFVVDTSQRQEVVAQSGVLTRSLLDQYDADPTIKDRRMPLIPNDIALSTADNGDTRAYVTALGADALFSVDYTAAAATPDPHFVNLRPSGRLPIGVALSRSQRFALVVNDGSDVVSVVSLRSGSVATRQDSVTGNRVDPAIRDGHENFATGLEVWSLKGEAWSSCESCHPEGSSDGIVWQFPRGPRRTISTAGTYFPDSTRRVLLWTANADEIHDVETIARGTSGGIGGVVWKKYTMNAANKNCRLLYDGTSLAAAGLAADVTDCPAPETTSFRLNGMNGSLSAITLDEAARNCEPNTDPCDLNASQDWDTIDAFIRSIAAPRAAQTCDAGTVGIGPACLDGARVARGKDLFQQYRCGGCHGGSGWTVSHMFYTPSLRNNGSVAYAKPTEPAVDPTDSSALVALLGDLRTETYGAGPLAPLNPPASAGTATFRSFAPSPITDKAPHPVLDYVYGSADQMNCVLRSVGTFPVQPAATADMPNPASNFTGVVPVGAPAVDESRETVSTDDPTMYKRILALGKDGFNVPALVGLGTTSSFFHAGNARTLEEALSPTFAAHYLSAAFGTATVLNPQQIGDLTSFLLSLDDDAETMPVASALDRGQPFNPDLCAQFVERR